MSDINWLGILELVKLGLYIFILWSGFGFVAQGETIAALCCFGGVGADALWVKFYLSRVREFAQEATNGN